MLEEILLPLEIPIVRDLPFGHGGANRSWAMGARASIDGERGEIELLESVVAGR